MTTSNLRFTLSVLAVACSGPPRSEPARPEVPAPDAAIAIDAAVDSPRHAALADADCRTLSSAGALAIATVASTTPDCSGVGHERIVFDVVRLVRGANVTKVVTSRALYGRQDRITEGDTFLIAIDPADHPAATVACVPLPAHQGTVKHLVRVASLAAGEQALAACPGTPP
jgi:hypothetical protein